MAKQKRGGKFVDAAVQGTLVRRILAYWGGFVLVSVLVVGFWQLLCAMDLARPWSHILTETWNCVAPLIIVGIFMLPIVVLDSIQFSHRFVGPVLRLRQSLEDMADGRTVAPLSQRKNDLWTDLIEAFNGVATRESAANQASVRTLPDTMLDECSLASSPDFADSLANGRR